MILGVGPAPWPFYHWFSPSRAWDGFGTSHIGILHPGMKKKLIELTGSVEEKRFRYDCPNYSARSEIPERTLINWCPCCAGTGCVLVPQVATLYGRRMSHSTRWDDGADRVEIVDLGAPLIGEPPATQETPVPCGHRRRWIIGAVIAAGLLSTATLLPAPLESQQPGPPMEAQPPPSTCPAVQRIQQSDAARDTVTGFPPGYTVLVVSVVETGQYSEVGLIHPDGLIELCADPTDLEAAGVVVRNRVDLGELPEGMSYAYQQPGGWSKEGLVLRVAGIRLNDGTVIDQPPSPEGAPVPAGPSTT